MPCAPIDDYGQVFTDEHLAARDFFWDAPHPALGPVRQIGSPMRFSRTPAVRGVAGPPLGADTRAVLTAGVRRRVDAIDARSDAGAAPQRGVAARKQQPATGEGA